MNRKKRLVPLFFTLSLLLWSCDYGQLGGADQTGAYYPGEAVFVERMEFLCGAWYSYYAGIGRLDGYRIRKWSDLTAADKKKMADFFPDFDLDNPITYTNKNPKNDDYILLYDGSVYGQQEDSPGENPADDIFSGGGFMGMVRAINIFNGDKDRGSIIIEYFKGADPLWLSARQGLARGEKPFFGIYYRALSPDIVQMANAVDAAAMYAGEHYYTEKATLDEAIEANNVENEAEFIVWGVVIPQDRA